MAKSTILVTGATGYLGSHVAAQLLEQGYTVRAAVRAGKSERIRGMFPDAGDKLQAIEIASLTSDFTLALKDVSAVIHCATPNYLHGATNQETLDGAYYGTLNIVNTAIKSGIKKIIITGSVVSQLDVEFKALFGTDVLDAKSYGDITLESIDLEKDAPSTVYQKAKTVADKKVWEIAHKNPDVDFTIILPPVILGPLVPNSPHPANRDALGTLAFIYDLIISGTDSYPPNPLGHMVDVRDAAKAHILALNTGPLKDGRNKRFNVCSRVFTWPEVAQILRAKRPELADRLAGASVAGPLQTSAPLDTQFAADVLGLTYIAWEETVLDSIDYLLTWEKAIGLKA